MKPKIEILFEALSKMEKEFTSFEFCDCIRDLGHPDPEVTGSSFFLKKHTVQLTAKTWRKKESTTNNNLVFAHTLKNEQTAIKFLKGLGYKIMKPVSDWTEV